MICHQDTGGKSHFIMHRFTINTIRTQHDVRGYATKIKDESSEIKRKISGHMAKDNHRTVGFKGSTHSISYNVRTTTCTVLGSAVQANTSPMQKPDSVTGQACLSSAVLTAHNIVLPEGVISRCTAAIVPIVFRQERISFYPKIAIISCFRTINKVLLRTKSNMDEF